MEQYIKCKKKKIDWNTEHEKKISQPQLGERIQRQKSIYLLFHLWEIQNKPKVYGYGSHTVVSYLWVITDL